MNDSSLLQLESGMVTVIGSKLALLEGGRATMTGSKLPF